MKEGIDLEEAIKGAEEEIERSKAYDAAGYEGQKALLERAASFLRSSNKK
jgi:hypothetical protein